MRSTLKMVIIHNHELLSNSYQKLLDSQNWHNLTLKRDYLFSTNIKQYTKQDDINSKSYNKSN